MSIQSIRKNVYGLDDAGLRKRAGWALPVMGGAIGAAGDFSTLGATYLVAAALMSGVGAGWLAAKTTAHGKQDETTARKGYEDERIKADIVYLKGKLRQEYSQAQRMGETPRTMRLL